MATQTHTVVFRVSQGSEWIHTEIAGSYLECVKAAAAYERQGLETMCLDDRDAQYLAECQAGKVELAFYRW